MLIPSDTDLQRLSDARLAALWASRPRYAEDSEWLRVAREVRYREKFRRPGDKSPRLA